jgi:cytochrome c553
VPACAGCHSPSGAGIPAQYPRLGGQHADYTEVAAGGLPRGLRANSAQMMSIAARMSDKEIKAVSDYIAGAALSRAPGRPALAKGLNLKLVRS